ncbi:MAG: hypothetical protein AAF548_13020 [Actinomycetota bacterium]
MTLALRPSDTAALDRTPADQQDGNALLGVVVALALYPVVFALVFVTKVLV